MIKAKLFLRVGEMLLFAALVAGCEAHRERDPHSVEQAIEEMMEQTSKTTEALIYPGQYSQDSTDWTRMLPDMDKFAPVWSQIPPGGGFPQSGSLSGLATAEAQYAEPPPTVSPVTDGETWNVDLKFLSTSGQAEGLGSRMQGHGTFQITADGAGVFTGQGQIYAQSHSVDPLFRKERVMKPETVRIGGMRDGERLLLWFWLSPKQVARLTSIETVTSSPGVFAREGYRLETESPFPDLLKVLMPIAWPRSVVLDRQEGAQVVYRADTTYQSAAAANHTLQIELAVSGGRNVRSQPDPSEASPLGDPVRWTLELDSKSGQISGALQFVAPGGDGPVRGQGKWRRKEKSVLYTTVAGRGRMILDGQVVGNVLKFTPRLIEDELDMTQKSVAYRESGKSQMTSLLSRYAYKDVAIPMQDGAEVVQAGIQGKTDWIWRLNCDQCSIDRAAMHQHPPYSALRKITGEKGPTSEDQACNAVKDAIIETQLFLDTFKSKEIIGYYSAWEVSHAPIQQTAEKIYRAIYGNADTYIKFSDQKTGKINLKKYINSLDKGEFNEILVKSQTPVIELQMTPGKTSSTDAKLYSPMHTDGFCSIYAVYSSEKGKPPKKMVISYSNWRAPTLKDDRNNKITKKNRELTLEAYKNWHGSIAGQILFDADFAHEMMHKKQCVKTLADTSGEKRKTFPPEKVKEYARAEAEAYAVSLDYVTKWHKKHCP